MRRHIGAVLDQPAVLDEAGADPGADTKIQRTGRGRRFGAEGRRVGAEMIFSQPEQVRVVGEPERQVGKLLLEVAAQLQAVQAIVFADAPH